MSQVQKGNEERRADSSDPHRLKLIHANLTKSTITSYYNSVVTLMTERFLARKKWTDFFWGGGASGDRSR